MIVEFILEDGEVISKDSPDFDFTLLKNVSFSKLEDFYIKKKIIAVLKENHKKTQNKSGVSDVNIKDFIKNDVLLKNIEELKAKNIVIQKQGVNNILYFINEQKLKK